MASVSTYIEDNKELRTGSNRQELMSNYFLGGRKRLVLRESQRKRYQKKKRDYANAVLISIYPNQRANLVGGYSSFNLQASGKASATATCFVLQQRLAHCPQAKVSPSLPVVLQAGAGRIVAEIRRGMEGMAWVSALS